MLARAAVLSLLAAGGYVGELAGVMQIGLGGGTPDLAGLALGLALFHISGVSM